MSPGEMRAEIGQMVTDAAPAALALILAAVARVVERPCPDCGGRITTGTSRTVGSCRVVYGTCRSCGWHGKVVLSAEIGD